MGPWDTAILNLHPFKPRAFQKVGMPALLDQSLDSLMAEPIRDLNC